MAEPLVTNPGVGATNTQGLSPFAAEYVTNYLAKAKALGDTEYEVYKNPLTAGPSDLQSKAFTAAGNLTVPAGIGAAATTAGDIATTAQGLSYSPTSFNNLYKAPAAYQPQTTDFFGNQNKTGFGGAETYYEPYSNLMAAGSSQPPSIAQQYMNPYLQASLDPQLAEAKRQSMIAQQANAAKMTQGGAFGGGRSAIMDAENQRNLGTKLADITGKGLDTAYTNAMTQFNADQARRLNEAQYGYTQGMTSADRTASYGMDAEKAAEQSKQFGSSQGLKGLDTALSAAQAQGSLSNTQNRAGLDNLAQMLSAGNIQRGIESEGITADLDEFNKQRNYPYENVRFMRENIAGLPISSVTNTTPTNSFTDTAQNITTLTTMLKALGLMK